MRITVLGKSPSWQDAGGACSGYLVEDGETRLLLDCGNGVFAKLRERVGYTDLDAVLISHLHADHFLDLVPYAYALEYAPRQQPNPVGGYPGTDAPARPRLIAPAGAREVFRRVVGRVGQGGPDREGLRARGIRRRLDGGGRAPCKPGSRRSPTSPPPMPSTSPRPTVAAGSPTAPTARPGDELIRIAKDTDLLLVEATLPRPERTGVRGHMTPAEAGDQARQAGAHRVVLTHISDELDSDWAREQGSEALRRPGGHRRGGRHLRRVARAAGAAS